jgi:mannose-1-phosphate guanylyltransferase/mannose-6-phosphate isomerase
MIQNSKNLYVVILAGGKGKRLWPLTENSVPKQFLNIIKKDTFLNHTIKRSLYLVKPENIYIVSLGKHSKQINSSLIKYNIPKKNLLLEPEAKNTAPAVLLAVSTIAKKDPESTLLISACDQLISGKTNFIEDSRRAFKACQAGFIVAFGIKPSGPETEYGYMKAGRKPKDRRINFSCYIVDEFIEKPAQKQAAKLTQSKNYSWSSGLFMAKSQTLLAEYKKNALGYYSHFMKKNYNGAGLKKIYHMIKPETFEKLIIQKSSRLTLIKAKFRWQDLGQWDLIYKALKKNKDKNVVSGAVVSSAVKNSLLLSMQKQVVCLGLKDVVVVDTEAGLLIADKNHLYKLKNALNSIIRKK